MEENREELMRGDNLDAIIDILEVDEDWKENF